MGQRCDVLPVNALHVQTYTPIISPGLRVTCLHVHVCFARFCLCVIRLCLSFPRPRVEISASESVVPFGEEEFIPIQGKGLNIATILYLAPCIFIVCVVLSFSLPLFVSLFVRAQRLVNWTCRHSNGPGTGGRD